MLKEYYRRLVAAALSACFVIGMYGMVSAQEFQLTTLVSFDGTNGSNPQAMVLGGDGSLYGTTFQGGANDDGIVFKLLPNGAFASLANFAITNGGNPAAAMTFGQDGLLYGTTENGGVGGAEFGCVFRTTTNGALTLLANFNYLGGKSPLGGLVQGPDGYFYGTTDQGGEYFKGTVFKIATNGALTPLVSLNVTNGSFPKAGLVWGPDGLLYGTTAQGGCNDRGTVFSLSTNGALTTLAEFNGSNGRTPNAALVFGGDGLLYGTTAQGGTFANGTVFKVTTNGLLTTLVHFNVTNGANPTAALTLGDDGWLYGTAANGGQHLKGTIFKVSTNGDFVNLLSFDGTNGASPSVALTLGADGSFYGTTSSGGAHTNGTIFHLSAVPSVTNLPPVISMQPVNHTNSIGTSAAFGVLATGTAPLRYQWWKDGVKLANNSGFTGVTTTNLTISSVQTNHAGNYQVVVTNAYGAVTSSIATLTVIRPASAGIQVVIMGKGTITGATNGQMIQAGQTVVPKVKAGKGYKLTNWLVQVDGATVISTNKAVPFVMQSNLVLVATFVDVQAPKLKVVSPKKKQTVQAEAIAITGTVKDNGDDGTVWYQLNGGSWEAASGWTNWNGLATLVPEANTLLVYAQDQEGNRSKTNVLAVTYQKAYQLADYFPQPLDGYWKYDGTDWDGWPAYMSWQIVDTNYPVDLHSGTQPVVNFATNSIKMVCAYLDHNSQVAYDTWEEFRGDISSQIVMYGHDDLPDESMRVGAGLKFPAQLTVGGSATVKGPVYSFGQYQGTMTATFQLLDVGSLTVPAGTFSDVIHLRFTISAGGGSEAKEWWWARGVGQIKSVGLTSNNSGLSFELVEYSVPGPNPNVAPHSQVIQLPDAQIDVASISLAGGQFTFNYAGVAGKTVVIEASADLTEWVPVQTNVLTEAASQFAVPAAGDSQRYFRLKFN